MNNRYVQLQGPFKAYDDLVEHIRVFVSDSFNFISSIGVQASVGNSIFINEKEVEIGHSNIYEVNNVTITTLYFKQDQTSTTILDLMLE